MTTLFKNEQEIEYIRAAGIAVASTLETLRKAILDGERNAESLDILAEITLQEYGAKSAFKGYKPPFHSQAFPSTICLSVNNEIVHGLPISTKILKDGDIVSLDLGAEINGWYADSAITVPVGQISKEAQKLIDTAIYSFKAGLKKAVAGNTIGDISAAVEKSVRTSGFKCSAGLQGHGIGQQPHEEPGVPNIGYTKSGMTIQAGLVICIEPMINAGTSAVSGGVPGQGDSWTIYTADGRLSSHHEHTIAITENGPIILTELPK